MRSLHPDQELDRIAAGLADSGALALLLIEAEPLARIERRYGGEAYRETLDNLMGLVRELAPWLALNRGNLVVCVHPIHGNDVADHRDFAVWLGAKLDLDLKALSG